MPLLFVSAIAAWFRLYKIGLVPFGLNNDAAWEGSAALDILRGNITPYLPYAAEGWRGEGIIRAVIALLSLIVGPNPIIIPLSTVFFGIALVPVVYIFIRRLAGSKLAFLTSFFIAVSGWHITMSKSGWRAVIVPLFATITFYFLWRARSQKQIRWYVYCGMALAATLYTYDAARVLPIFLIFWILYSGRTTLKGLGGFAAGFFVTIAPLAFYALGNWANFTSRGQFLFIGHEIERAGNLWPLLHNLRASALLFTHRANGNDFFIDQPLLDPWVRWFFPIGFFVVIWHAFGKGDRRYLFMLLWFFVSLVAGILSVPNGNRAIGAIPAVYFMISAGLVFISQQFRKLAFAIIALVCVTSAFTSYRDYLSPYRHEPPGFYPETLIATNYIRTIWDEYDIYLTDNYPRETLTYLLYRGGDPFVRTYTWYERNADFLSVAPRGPKGVAFFMFATPTNERIATLLMDKFPQAEKFYLGKSLVVLVPLMSSRGSMPRTYALPRRGRRPREEVSIVWGWSARTKPNTLLYTRGSWSPAQQPTPPGNTEYVFGFNVPSLP